MAWRGIPDTAVDAEMSFSNSRPSYYPPIAAHPRPKVKATFLVDGIPVRVCESLEEMQIRLSGLRRPGDTRSVERILYATDDTRAWARKGFRRSTNGGAE